MQRRLFWACISAAQVTGTWQLRVLSADYMNAGKLVELEDEVVVTEQQLAVIRTMHEVY